MFENVREIFMTNTIYKEAQALNQEKWTIHFNEYTLVNLSRYKIPQFRIFWTPRTTCD